MCRLISAAPLSHYRLRLKYDDGETGTVDVSPLVGRGVFQLWNDPEAFARLEIGTAGELRWNDEVDLCGDALYLQLTGKQPGDIFRPLAPTVEHA